MALVLNGSGSITGLSAGGLPDGSVTADDIASLPAGSVLQVVQGTYGTSSSTTSTSFTTTNLTASITPSNASNKVLVLVSLPAWTDTLGSYNARYTIFRGTTSGTNLGNSLAGLGMISVFSGATGYTTFSTVAMNYLDSPNTTSSQLYTVAARSEGNSSTAAWCGGSATATITLMEIAA
jgi:hypothetical protein